MKYDILMVDPPWPVKKGGKRAMRPNQGRYLDYPTMSLSEIEYYIEDLIKYVAKKRHIVFLWEIDKFVVLSEMMMIALGYKKHCRFVWNKMNGIAPAFSVRFTHEYLTWYYMGKFRNVDEKYMGKFRTCFSVKSREHSRKPDYAYGMVERLFPGLKKVDVFSREEREGWDQIGDECDYFDGRLVLTTRGALSNE